MIEPEKDWLAQEIKYESKISAWDFDEPNKVKKMHEDNCPRESLAQKHIEVHQDNEHISTIQSRFIDGNNTNLQSKQAQKVIYVFIFFVLTVMISFIATIIAIFE